jgi:DmsE family decaheme c-type cytochrome
LHTKQTTNPKKNLLPILGFMILAAGAFLLMSPAETMAHQDQDFETCLDCHEDVVKAFSAMPHAAGGSCTGCHGNAEEHLEEGGGPNIFAFKDTDSANSKAGKCLTCHVKSNPRYMASPHGKAAMDCTACHSAHARTGNPAQLRMAEPKSCTVCHENVMAEFQLNERHRLVEGIMTCTSCHDPHEPSARERLGGFKHEACLKCHTDKGGPFLHEHDASRIEGCSSCHEVHGSPNRRMLTHQSIADLCFSCHGAAPSWHARFDHYSSNCTTCHSTIHGSNLSKIFIK